MRPSAIAQNFNEEPSATGSTAPMRSMNTFVRSLRWERLAAILNGDAAGVRTRIACSLPLDSHRNAPRPAPPYQAVPVTGASTTP